ncbi:MAG: hydrogenase maturation nickel metallochaperone HypA [Bacteroidetes bacterium]|nr:MAG: hydrogenase maturation nickel metallochaperone HypA [Bacteroidota bacterium]
MHELSIALGIVKIAEEESRKANAKVVTSIELEIGTMAGIEMDSLDFAWPVAVKDTVLENAKREIDLIPAKAKCLECQTEYDLEHTFDVCPSCNSYFKDIFQGKELRVKALEVE